MDIKEQVLRARELIQEQRYAEARAILVNVDHPKAREWIAKIDEVAPEIAESAAVQRGATRPRPASHQQPLQSDTLARASVGRLWLLVAGIGIIALVLIVVIVLPNLNQNTAVPSNTPAAAQNNPTDASTPAVTSDPPTAEAANPTQSAATLPPAPRGEGLRIPVLLSNGVLNMDLPAGWRCQCGSGTVTLYMNNDFRNSARMRQLTKGFDVDAYKNVPLADILKEDADDDETIDSQEMVTDIDREVLSVAVTRNGRQEMRLYAKDTAGRVMRWELGSNAPDKAGLMAGVLGIIATAQIDDRDAATELTAKLLSARVAYNKDLNRWRIADNLAADREHFVEMPEGWSVSAQMLGLPMLVKSTVEGPTDTAVVYISRSYYSSDSTLEDILTSFVGGDEVKALQTVQFGGRDVAFGTFIDTDNNNSESVNYIVRDSDDEVVVLIVQPQVTDKASLHNDLLAMISKAEVVEVDYLVRLRRVGLLPADGSSDGYELVDLN